MRNRRFNRWGWLLAVAFGLSSCADDVDEMSFSSHGRVKTQFSLTIPDVQKTGRMTATDVQESGNNFLGISDLRLYPFAQANLAGDTELQVGNMLAKAEQTTLPSLPNTNHSVWYDDVEIPEGSRQMLMYGVATPKSDAFKNGKTQTSFANITTGATTGNSTLADIKFTPAQILDKTAFDKNSFSRNWISFMMNAVIKAQTSTGEQRWCTATGNLGQLYKDFVMEATGGGILPVSSATILAYLEKLYNEVEACRTENETLVDAIQGCILQKYGSADFIQLEVKEENGRKKLQYVVGSQIPDYPQCMNIPDGALYLQIIPQANAPATVEDLSTIENADFSAQAYEYYAYPAQLYYTANTPIWTSAQEVAENERPTVDWNTIDQSKYNFTTAPVSSSTKTVVMRDPVRYGMANLKTSVKLKQEDLPDSSDPEKKVTFANGLTWTGLMVADQREVGWNFSREHVGLNTKSFVVYDKQLNGGDQQKIVVKTIAQQATPTPNYTLVYPSRKVAGNAPISAGNTDVVHLILEFENGDTEFRGAGGGLILPHTRFYLMGALDLSKLTADQLGDRRQIFEPHHRTEVNFTINNLKKAYNVVPDLRRADVELGLSVDVVWDAGFDFGDVEVNGH